MDISDADAAFESLSLSGAAPSVPPLPLRQPPPALAERSVGSPRGHSGGGGGGGGAMYSMLYGGGEGGGGGCDTARSSASGMASARSGGGGEGGEEMSEAEVLAELEGSLPPSEFRNFQAAVISGEHFDCMLRLTPIRLAILSKQIEALSGRKPPSLIKQKKDYVVSHWRLALARAAHRDLVQSPTPQTPLRRTTPIPPTLARSRAPPAAATAARRRRAPPGRTTRSRPRPGWAASCAARRAAPRRPDGGPAPRRRERRVAPRTAAAAAAGVAVRRGRRRRRRPAARLAKGRHPSS